MRANFETRSSVTFEPQDPAESRIALGSRGHLSDWTLSLTIGGEIRQAFFGTRDGFLTGIGLNLE